MNAIQRVTEGANRWDENLWDRIEVLLYPNDRSECIAVNNSVTSPYFVHNHDEQGGISLASGRTTHVLSSLSGTVPDLDVRLLIPASPQSFRDIWPSGPIPAEMPHTDGVRHRVTQRHMIWNLIFVTFSAQSSYQCRVQ